MNHEPARIKLLLVSVAVIVLGLTLTVLPVQATTTDAGPYLNLPITNTLTLNLGHAPPGSVVNVALTTVGGYRLTVRNTDTDIVLFSQDDRGGPLSPPPIAVDNPGGNIQVQVSSIGGSTATLNIASISHSTMTYPLQLPGVALLAAGVAIVLTRVWRVGISVSRAPTPR